MRKSFKYVGLSTLLLCSLLIIWQSQAVEPIRISKDFSEQYLGDQPDTIINQNEKLPYPIKENTGDPLTDGKSTTSPLYLNDPPNIGTDIEYNPETGEYRYQRKVGDIGIAPPVTMSIDEYSQYQLEKAKRDYWSKKARSSEFNDSRAFVPSFQIRSEAFDKVFGSNTINITPQGSAEVIFGFTMNRIDNPQLSERLRRTPSFTFKEKIQMNVTGKIGDKMEMGINYNTEATFDFENKTKLQYAGDEDEIIKKIEAGNVTLPLPGSLITGSQSLFGVKTELQFGKLTMTTVFSHQKGQSSVIDVEGGSQVNEFEVSVDDYDANRHFFLSHYFRERYDRAMSGLPLIRSDVQLEEIEVWVTNKTKNFEGARNIVALVDIGEFGNNISNPYVRTLSNPTDSFPHNNTNGLYEQIKDNDAVRDIGLVSAQLQGINLDNGVDFEKIENARKLNPREYTLNRTLGYISLNTALNADEVLAVAYRYKRAGDEEYQKVGELTNNAPSAPGTLIVKLIKGTNLSPKFKTWDLMMKNVYAIGAYQVNKKDFMLNIFYQDDENGQPVNYLPGDRTDEDILLRVFGLDKLNIQNEPYEDGLFDYLSGITIIPSNGRIIFPTVEPFGEALKKYLVSKYGSYELYKDSIDRYLFTELYDSTKTKAQQIAEKNKFIIAGEYNSSSGSEIQLNAMNVPRGSVKVTAGGIQLAENVDFTVDYTLGRVKIINPGLLESGTPIRISLESNTLFNLQTKTLIGTHLNYKFSDNFYLGGTVLNLTERPLTKKVNFGDEPISNTIWGLNGSYRTEAPFLTSLVDKIPLIETKEMSNITIDGEFAHLIPGSSKAVGKKGKAYIDDFEGSETSIDMKSLPAWVLASTPQGNGSKFPEASQSNNLAYGYNRAKLAWYVIDDLFQENTSRTPDHIKSDEEEQSNHFVRTVLEQEIFPNRDRENNIPSRLPLLNVAFYPNERGPYNYDVEPTPYSQGIDEEGFLNAPETRWGGIMREVLTSDFESANIEFIEFWMLDPFAEDTTAYFDPNYLGSDPALYFNLGNVSEDILKDSRKSFENGLPTTGDSVAYLDTTVWGLVSRAPQYQNAFDTDPESRKYQDVGLDGMSTEQEQKFFKDTYLDRIAALHGDNSTAFQKAFEDPSNDDFHYYRGRDYDEEERGVLERYKEYNNYEQNSRTSEQSVEGDYPTTGKNSPDVEDINRDNTLSEGESYFEYKISLRPDRLKNEGQNYITDIVDATPKLKNGEREEVRWLQFKIPLEDFEDQIGAIDDFKSIRFMRMYLHGLEKEVVLRFAELNLIRSEWRKYKLPLYDAIEYVEDQDERGTLDISAVNIEENGNKEPVNYILPPGADREIDPSNPQIRQLNEQAMVLKVTDLADGDARAAYKNVGLDLRQYKKLIMDIHAEALPEPHPGLEDGELTAFIRIGSDYVNNFYEYEVPLVVTPKGKYNSGNETDRTIVWPDSNKMEIDLELFTEVKLKRNEDKRRANSNIDYNTIYEAYDGNNRVLIRGNPNLSNVRTIMIGVRNPKRPNYLQETNDGYEKSGEIWVNELRLTDFRDKGGWAANARIKANLADFGTVSIAGATSTPGFGSIEQKVNERDKEDVFQYDITTNLELGKFFPEKAAVSIPLFVGYSKTTITPEYNPLEPDILLDEALNQNLEADEKNAIIENAVDETVRKSINLTNVKVNKSGQTKKRLYDPANFAVSYSYSEKTHKNINIKGTRDLNYRAAFSYNFNQRPKNVAPLSNVKALNNPYLRLIKDFNFYYMPSRLSFRTDLNRQYRESQLRNLSTFRDSKIEIPLPKTVFKDYTWNRYYDLKFDLTRSLKFDFSATTVARFDESMEPLDQFGVLGLEPDYNEELEKYNFGRILNYNHNIRLSYSVPINKIPLFSWTSLNTQYNAKYNWQAGPQKLETSGFEDPESSFGNTISNAYSFSINNSNRLTTLYNKVKYFKMLEQKYSPRGKAQQEKEYKTVTFVRERVIFKANTPRSIQHKLKTEDVKVTVSDENGNELNADIEIVDDNKIRVALDQDIRGTTIQVEGQVEKKANPLIFITDQTIRMLIGVKDININYSESRGTILPGYLPNARILGFDEDVLGRMAPGAKFVLGMQDKNLLRDAANNGWLTKNQYQLTPFTSTFNKNLDIRSTFEPFKGFNITLNANKTRTQNLSQTFSFNTETGRFNIQEDGYVSNAIEQGSYSISTITLKTAFEKFTSDDNYKSKAFEEFKALRQEVSVIKSREMQENPNFSDYNPYEEGITEPGYTYGYGSTSKEVLVPAFLAAYTGRGLTEDVQRKFPEIPLPNWRLSFDGLSKIEFIQKYIRNISITHSYRSRYNIGSYGSNLDYGIDGDDGLPIRDLQANFMGNVEINTVSIEEQLSPLIGFDMSWHNSLTTRLEIKKTRSLGLNFANNQLIELNNNEWIIGTGYSIRDVELVINAGSGQKAYQSDLNIRADLSIRDSKTIIRNINLDQLKSAETPNDVTAGERRFTIKTTMDYQLSDSFNISFYFDRVMNRPATSLSFPYANTNVGFSVRFTLIP